MTLSIGRAYIWFHITNRTQPVDFQPQLAEFMSMDSGIHNMHEFHVASMVSLESLDAIMDSMDAMDFNGFHGFH